MVVSSDPKSLAVQAAGHAQTLLEDVEDSGFILKPHDAVEALNYENLWSSDKEPLHAFIAPYGGVVNILLDSRTDEAQVQSLFMRIGNLLVGFNNPRVMDCKMGVRTFQESEAANMKPRGDLYKKLVKLKPEVITPEEKEAQAITKHKWLTVRDSMSTTTTLGFRIEGICSKAGSCIQPELLKGVAKFEDVYKVLPLLLPPKIAGDAEGTRKQRSLLMRQILQRIEDLNKALDESKFFTENEIIGSSLLFVVDAKHANVFMIDFAKTSRVPAGIKIDHYNLWQPGNHEDGFKIGLDSLLGAWKEVLRGLEDEQNPESYFNDSYQEAEIARLELQLLSHGVDTSKFGVGKAKSMAELFWEIHVEKATTLEVNEEGKLIRVMDVMKAWILTDLDGITYSLMETKRHRVDSVRPQQIVADRKEELKPIQQKVSSGETWEEALNRTLENRLSMSFSMQEKHFKVKHESYRGVHADKKMGTVTHGFPGLASVYQVHEVDVRIPHPTSLDLASIGLPEARDFTTIQPMADSAFGSHARKWKWMPLTQTDYTPPPARPSSRAKSMGRQAVACFSPILGLTCCSGALSSICLGDDDMGESQGKKANSQEQELVPEIVTLPTPRKKCDASTPHMYVVDAGSSSSRLSRMTLDPTTGLIQKRNVGEVGGGKGSSDRFIIGEMLKLKDLKERQARFDSFLDILAGMLRDDTETDTRGPSCSLGVTVIATAAVRQQLNLPPSSYSDQLRAAFGGDMSNVSKRLGFAAFDAVVLSAETEALYEGKAALFALDRAGDLPKIDGLVSAGGMSSQMVWFDEMTAISITMAWKQVITHFLEAQGLDVLKVEKMKKDPVEGPNQLAKLRELWATNFLASEERRRILDANASVIAKSSNCSTGGKITGRWIFISGFVALFGALGMVPLEHLGSDKPVGDPALVRAQIFGERYGRNWSPPQTFRAHEVRSLLSIFFQRVPTLTAEGALMECADKGVQKALSSAAQYMRVATAVHLEAILSIFDDEAEIYFSKAETHRESGETMEYSVNVGYALSILVLGFPVINEHLIDDDCVGTSSPNARLQADV